jgi:GNAT superfamily N-acetyltransferase
MITLRPSLAGDAPVIFSIAESESLFSRQDLTTVQELFQDYVSRSDHNGYYFISAVAEDDVIGFACYGPTPLTTGTFDLYWIDVADAWKGKGVGKQLMANVVDAVRAAGGRLLVLDTSGRQDYASTRAFYERFGFKRSATIPDFYAPGDDLVIYTLPLAG